jgi:hypothetical protein
MQCHSIDPCNSIVLGASINIWAQYTMYALLQSLNISPRPCRRRNGGPSRLLLIARALAPGPGPARRHVRGGRGCPRRQAGQRARAGCALSSAHPAHARTHGHTRTHARTLIIPHTRTRTRARTVRATRPHSRACGRARVYTQWAPLAVALHNASPKCAFVMCAYSL